MHLGTFGCGSSVLAVVGLRATKRLCGDSFEGFRLGVFFPLVGLDSAIEAKKSMGRELVTIASALAKVGGGQLMAVFLTTSEILVISCGTPISNTSGGLWGQTDAE